MHAVRSTRLGLIKLTGQQSWDSPLGTFLIRSLVAHTPHRPHRPQRRHHSIASTVVDQHYHPSPSSGPLDETPLTAAKMAPEPEKLSIGSFLVAPGTGRPFNPLETIADSLTANTPAVRGHTIFSGRSPDKFDSVSPKVMMNDAVNTRNVHQIWHTYCRLVRNNKAPPGRPLFTSSVYFRIIRAFQSSRTENSAMWAQSVYEDMVKYHQPRIQTLNTLLDILIRHSETKWAIDYFKQEASRFDIRPNTRSYNLMIRGFVASGRVESAQALYADLRSGAIGVQPDVITYSTLMGHYNRQGMHNEADRILEEIFKDKVKPNMWIYNSVVKRFVVKKDYVGAKKVLDLMKESGLKPDVVTYSTLIDGYADDGNEVAIAQLQSEMAVNQIYPNEKTITSTINVFARARLEEEIDSRLEAVLKSLPEGEMKDHTFGVLTHVYGKRRDLDAAMGIYRHIITKGRTVNACIINALLDGYIKADQVPAANKIFHNHFTVNGTRPSDSWTYSIMITGCCKQGSLSDALYYYHEMTRFNVALDAITGSRMIQLYLQHHQPDNAHQMLRRMNRSKLSVAVQTYTMLIQYMTDIKNTRGALRYYQEMLDFGVKPDCHCYTALINARIRAKDFDGCQRTYMSMIKSGVTPTLETHTSMIHVYSLQGNIEKVKEQWVAMTDAGLVPDIKSFTLLMQTYTQTANVEMVEFIFKELSSKKLLVDTIALTTLMSVYAELPHLNVTRIEEISGMLHNLELEPTSEYFKLLLNMYGRHHMPDRVIRTWRELRSLDEPLDWVPTTSNTLHLIEACRDRGYIDTLHAVWRLATQGPQLPQQEQAQQDSQEVDGVIVEHGPTTGQQQHATIRAPTRYVLNKDPEIVTAYLNALLTHNRFQDIENLLKNECRAIEVMPRTEDFELLFTGLAQYEFLKKELQSIRSVVVETWPSVQPLVDRIIMNTRPI
ncbi:hypothetical protein BG004_002759 [Podila humilis]|nr:hypothetical protein BG004_002759 [Podila humilis]